ncbi:hypothetical protein RAS2_05940 [Phycisphaerae bacterium RAS2]|nr:hypothetical protein RAS2_05940 [Phycisphaerae bacterium RAS2]
MYSDPDIDNLLDALAWRDAPVEAQEWARHVMAHATPSTLATVARLYCEMHERYGTLAAFWQVYAVRHATRNQADRE